MNLNLLPVLVCPLHQANLSIQSSSELRGACGCTYPVANQIPVLIPESTVFGVDASNLSRISALSCADDPLFLNTVGFTPDQLKACQNLIAANTASSKVDPVVSYMIEATNGIAYREMIGKLKYYPIPEIRLPTSAGASLLDIGCNWGRWSISASQKGYCVIGLDPQLGAVAAAQRVASQLGVNPSFVAGDGRKLPFKDSTFDYVFSYSVLQHLPKNEASDVLKEIHRVLKPGGKSMIQMPNWLGIRCLYHQLRRGFQKPSAFEVRYWEFSELKRVFTKMIGTSKISVDCYFGLGLQMSDKEFMSQLARKAVVVSEFLRRFSQKIPLLVQLADSLIIESTKSQ